MSDEEITELFLSRSESALEELRTKYDRLGRSVAGGFLHDERDIDETLSDSYLEMWNSIPPQRPKILSAFFCSVVRNHALKRLRHDSALKRAVTLVELSDTVSDRPSDEDEIIMISQIISSFLSGLDRRSRVLFLKRYYMGMSVKDSAREIGLSEGAAMERLSRIRKRLRSALEKEGISI